MRELKVGSYVQVIQDKDSGMLVGRKGTLTSISNDYYWIKFNNHNISLPFSADEIKPANRTKKK